MQCRRPGFNPWVGKFLWRRERKFTPIFLPRESHGQRSLAGYSLWGCQELDTSEQLTPCVSGLISSCKKVFFQFWGELLGASVAAHGLSLVLENRSYRSGLLCPPPGDLPNPGIKLRSPELQVDSLLSEPPGKPKTTRVGCHPFSRGSS